MSDQGAGRSKLLLDEIIVDGGLGCEGAEAGCAVSVKA